MAERNKLSLVKEEAENVEARFSAVLKRANVQKPKPADVAELRRLLGDNPEAELWRNLTTIMDGVEQLIFLKSGLTETVATLWGEQLKGLRKDLNAASAPPLERLLIQHIAVCWLRLAVVEIGCVQNATGSHTLTAGAYWDKRLSMAQRRFTRAVESLAKVRRLALPASRPGQMPQANVA